MSVLGGRLGAAAIWLVATATPVDSGYITYRQWSTMSGSMRAGYVMGVVDQILDHNVLDSAEISIWRFAVHRCLTSRQYTSGVLTDLVTNYYERHTSRWGDPTSSVLNSAIDESCGDIISADRAAAGFK